MVAIRATFDAMELIDLPEFGPDQVAQIVDGEPDPWTTGHLSIEWRPKTAHLGLTDRGRLIGHAGWVPVQLHGENGQVLEVLGLGGVIVHRDHRGHGAGAQLVSGATTSMAAVGGVIGMLFCRTERLAFYDRLGWIRIGATVTADQPAGPVTVPLHACWRPLVEGAALPPTDLHVEGLPF
jgi:GNAT superfamily N-acetyltransferase